MNKLYLIFILNLYMGENKPLLLGKSPLSQFSETENHWHVLFAGFVWSEKAFSRAGNLFKFISAV